ncbi:MAG: HAD family hydrolase [Mycoplasmatales bacterium]
MKKLFVSDLDGTLLNEKHELDENGIRSINMLIDNDYTVVLASGRSYELIRPFHTKLGLKTPIIANNGASIVDSNDNYLFNKTINEKDVQYVLDYVFENNIDFLIHTNSQVYMYGENEFILQKENMLNDEGKLLHKRVFNREALSGVCYVTKILLLVNNCLDKKELHKNHLGENKNLNVLESDIYLLDIMAKGVDKYNAILKYMQLEPHDHLTTIGDNENDLLMIKEADIGIAMKNGVDSVLQEADFISPKTNKDAGHVSAVEYLIKGEK